MLGKLRGCGYSFKKEKSKTFHVGCVETCPLIHGILELS